MKMNIRYPMTIFQMINFSYVLMFISFCMEKRASVGSNFGSKAVQVSVTRSQLYIIIQLAISI